MLIQSEKQKRPYTQHQLAKYKKFQSSDGKALHSPTRDRRYICRENIYESASVISSVDTTLKVNTIPIVYPLWPRERWEFVDICELSFFRSSGCGNPLSYGGFCLRNFCEKDNYIT
jgi:hypothetical protein